jgi:class 3 adenylate cyclase
MSSQPDETLKLEIAHVLFVDIVSYSKLPMDQQVEALQVLNSIVRDTDEHRRAEQSGQLIRLPTGDGMALVFFGDAEAALRCAREIGRAMWRGSNLKLRMGVHSGPVYLWEKNN